MVKKGSIFNFCLCLLGVVGTIGCFLNMYALPVNNLLMQLLMVLTTLFYFYLYGNHRKHQTWMKWVLLSYVGILVVTYFYWKDGASFILNTMFRTYEANSQYTFQRLAVGRNLLVETYIVYLTLWLLFTPMSMIITRSIQGRHSYSLCFASTIPYLFSILLFTLRPDPIYFNMVLIFWFALVGMGTAGYYKVYNTSTTIRHLAILFSSSALVLVLILSILFPERQYIRDPKIEDIRVTIQTKIRELFEDQYEQNPGELDLRSAGNRYYMNSDQLQIQMEEPETLFLHGYSGTLYEDNRWSNPSYDNSYKLDQMNVTHPFNFARLAKENNKEKEVQIIYQNTSLEYLYTPYYVVNELRENYEVISDQYIIREKKTVSPMFQFVDIRDVDITSIEGKEEQTNYFAMIKEANLQVPNHVSAYLDTLRIDGMRESLSYSEKINVIQNYVQSFGRYTLSPGTTPDNQDFVIYFLETSKEGYCVHYASTAVMLLRYYGIPARFASGYRVDGSSFQDGVAVAKDYNEHAWVEIYDPTFGWTPLEVTPASLVESDDPDTPIIQPNQRPNQNNPPMHQDPSQTNPNQDPNVNLNTNTTSTSLWRILRIGIVFALLLLMFPICRSLRLARMQQKMKQKDRKQAILYCGYYLEKIQHQKQMDPKIFAILNEAKYSNHPMLDEQHRQVVEYCAQAAKMRRDEANKWNRWLDTYVRAYY